VASTVEVEEAHGGAARRGGPCRLHDKLPQPHHPRGLLKFLSVGGFIPLGLRDLYSHAVVCVLLQYIILGYGAPKAEPEPSMRDFLRNERAAFKSLFARGAKSA